MCAELFFFLALIDPPKIYNLVEAILYVRSNEPTKRIIFVHAYEDVETIPTELEANSKILDEAFPVSVPIYGRFNVLTP